MGIADRDYGPPVGIIEPEDEDEEDDLPLWPQQVCIVAAATIVATSRQAMTSDETAAEIADLAWRINDAMNAHPRATGEDE